MTAADQPDSGHPRVRRWGASAAALVAAGLFIPLPQQVSSGQELLPCILVVLLLIPLTVVQGALRREGGWEPSPRLLRILALTVLAFIGIAEAIVLGRLLLQLSQIKNGALLFRAAALVWAINILVFSLCYWELDGGGPESRAKGTDGPGAFLFPQQMNEKLNQGWAPEFLDYLFLAFNTTTAFSPTDTMILSRPAKALMMIQSGISLLTVALVVGRGVNLIG